MIYPLKYKVYRNSHTQSFFYSLKHILVVFDGFTCVDILPEEDNEAPPEFLQWQLQHSGSVWATRLRLSC